MVVEQPGTKVRKDVAKKPTVPVMMIDRFSFLLQKIDLAVSDKFLFAALGVFTLADPKTQNPTVCVQD